jgi:plastocyanin
MRSLRIGTIACGTAAALALPAAAGAATKTVTAGPPSYTQNLVPKAFGKKYQPDVDAFFQTHVTIHAGDTVQWINNGFHTIDIPKAGGKDLPLFVPGAPVSGVKDAAGNPLWFNGKVPSLGFNPTLFAASGGSTYDGSARIDSGLPLGPPAPFKVTFTKAGTYRYFCDVHPGMVGYVVVKSAGKPIPSARQDAKTVRAQVDAAIAAAHKLAKTKFVANRVSLGLSGPGGLEFFGMFPARLKVKRGAVVTFSTPVGTRETHTATFGPKAYLTGLQTAFGGPAPPQIGFYPSAPGQPIPLGPTTHGNGFANTGALDRDPGTPLPATGRIRFLKAGTYRFVCLIHNNMSGTIIVK